MAYGNILFPFIFQHQCMETLTIFLDKIYIYFYRFTNFSH